MAILALLGIFVLIYHNYICSLLVISYFVKKKNKNLLFFFYFLVSFGILTVVELILVILMFGVPGNVNSNFVNKIIINLFFFSWRRGLFTISMNPLDITKRREDLEMQQDYFGSTLEMQVGHCVVELVVIKILDH